MVDDFKKHLGVIRSEVLSTPFYWREALQS